METFFLLGMSQTGVYQVIFWLINMGEVGLFLLGVWFGFVLRAVFDSRKGLFPILVLVAKSRRLYLIEYRDTCFSRGRAGGQLC
jgi:hypothetical protein